MKCFAAFIIFFSFSLHAETEAFGAPGAKPNWAPASKTHIGTAFSSGTKSPVWFTSAEGILTEVYYPTVDKAQIKDSQILVTDGKSFLAQEKRITHKTEVISPAEAHLINSDVQNRYSITHNYFTDPSAAVLYDEVTINANVDGLSFYLLTNPHINNSGYSDSARVEGDGFVISENQLQLAITSSVGFKNRSVGFVGSSDGFQDLSNNFKLDYKFTTATNGNTATTGELNIPTQAGIYKIVLAYSFKGMNPFKKQKMLDVENIRKSYFDGWSTYLNQLKVPSNLSYQEKMLYLRSLFTLKCHEDKAQPGAIIASISIPWGESQFDSPGVEIGGYHLIWPRDLYNIASSLLFAGDTTTALNALRFMKKIQFHKNDGYWNFYPRVFSKDGSFPQNVWVNGKTYWEGFQIDQTGYPVLLFYHIFLRANASEKLQLMNEFGPMVVDALNFIAKNGPWTQEERWEENFGISPSSFSAATAALFTGARLFDDEYGQYLNSTAMSWLTKPYDNIDTWTFTSNGFYGDGQYYLRIAGGDRFDGIWNPNLNISTHVANSNNRFDQRRILDQGFLQLSLLGLKSAADEKIKKTEKVIDDNISVMTPNGRGYYRYSFDAYGENGQGRLWPLLSGEHARYYIERFRAKDLNWNQTLKEINSIIGSMYNFANEGLMIPEQVFETTGEGTGSATPLAWAHAEYIKLLWSKEYKQNVENIFN